MKLEENRDAGWGVREFHNVELPPDGPRPGHIDLGWSSKVVQRGTKETTGRLWDVTVYFQVGARDASITARKRIASSRQCRRIARTGSNHCLQS